MTCASLAHATEQALATCKSGQPAILQVTTVMICNNDIHIGEKNGCIVAGLGQTKGCENDAMGTENGVDGPNTVYRRSH